MHWNLLGSFNGPEPGGPESTIRVKERAGGREREGEKERHGDPSSDATKVL